jgi:hypothetical protein
MFNKTNDVFIKDLIVLDSDYLMAITFFKEPKSLACNLISGEKSLDADFLADLKEYFNNFMNFAMK